MGKIHCIHCNQINDDNEIICNNCHKTLYELDKYYTDMLKDHLTGKVKDSVTGFLLQLIKENLYGIIMTITIVSTVVVNVAIRSDNPEVVSEITKTNEIAVHSDGIKSSTQYEALKVLGKAYYDKDYDLLNKSSYLYNFGNKYSSDIKKLTNYGTTLEEITEKHMGKFIYLQFEYYNEERYKELYDKYLDNVKHALYPLTNENEYASVKVNIPNIEDIDTYNVEALVFSKEPYGYENREALYLFTVVYVKIDGSWYYLYSTTAEKRKISDYYASMAFVDNDFVYLAG